MKIRVIEYGAGNWRSVVNGCREVGFDAERLVDPADLADADRIIFPGVGSFGAAVAALRHNDLWQPIVDALDAGIPFLGICLGMQLLCEGSDESPGVGGFRRLDGVCKLIGSPASLTPTLSRGERENRSPLPPGESARRAGEGVKIPQLGWNELQFDKNDPLFQSVESGSRVYFANSYALPAAGQPFVAARTEYGGPMVAAIRRGSLYGTQFHPEKSGEVGLTILKNFLEKSGSAQETTPQEKAVRRAGTPCPAAVGPADNGRSRSDRPTGERTVSALAKRIIPCLDVDQGRVVKGVKFQDLQDQGDPVELARTYYETGADELVFLDITASSDGREAVKELVGRVARQVFIPLTVGGGVRGIDDIRDLLGQGADKVGINTAALDRPELINEAAGRFGSQAVVLSADVKRTPTGWTVTSHGGRQDRKREALAWVREAVDRGAGEILLNVIDADGCRSGYATEITRAVSRAAGVPVIASGGAGRLEDFLLAFTEGEADAALAASVFHSGEITPNDVKAFLRDKGVPVR